VAGVFVDAPGSAGTLPAFAGETPALYQQKFRAPFACLRIVPALTLCYSIDGNQEVDLLKTETYQEENK
jgi:hypothetical protein